MYDTTTLRSGPGEQILTFGLDKWELPSCCHEKPCCIY